jgi:hypothetical protein
MNGRKPSATYGEEDYILGRIKPTTTRTIKDNGGRVRGVDGASR